jgi:ribosomal protein S18 acetylase RimI-like enzyme
VSAGGSPTGEAQAEARRLEERALNASGAFQSLVYDGWLLGYRAGPTKRLRCVNPFYPSTLPVREKVAWCSAFYAAANLPPIFRLLPFSEPASLDSWLERNGWVSFERTLVQQATLANISAPALPQSAVEIVDALPWVDLTARLLDADEEALLRIRERTASFPLPQAGALIRRDGEIVACGLLKLEGEHAGLFAVHTAQAWRGRGLGRAIVGALLGEARRRAARIAYLQVTAENAPALALYAHFGFASVYDYWYRGRAAEQRMA